MGRRVFILFLMEVSVTEPVQRRELAVEGKALDDAIKTVAREYSEDLL